MILHASALNFDWWLICLYELSQTIMLVSPGLFNPSEARTLIESNKSAIVSSICCNLMYQISLWILKRLRKNCARHVYCIVNCLLFSIIHTCEINTKCWTCCAIGGNNLRLRKNIRNPTMKRLEQRFNLAIHCLFTQPISLAQSRAFVKISGCIASSSTPIMTAREELRVLFIEINSACY